MTRHDKQIVIAIGIVALVFLGLWMLAPGRFSDFGLNGFTETLGIAFTVLLIERLLSRREAVRTLPQRLAAFEDVRLLAQRRITFWHQAYMLAVPDPLPTSVQGLFSKTTIARIGSLLDMDSYANVTPRRTWWQYIPEDLQSFHDSAQRILERYNSILDPEAFLAIHEMLNRAIEPGLPLGILQSDREMGIPRPTVLGAYAPILQDHFDALLRLIEWLVHEKARLSHETGHELGRIDFALQGNRSDGTPPCMISPEKIAQQENAWQEFQQKSAA